MTDFEVIVSDNGSTDGTPQLIRQNFPDVCVIENGANLRFAKGNNAGIQVSRGEYILILNPDTIIHDASLDRWIEFAERHPEAGGFGCRVLNPDGSYQGSARPFPTAWRDWIAALYLRPLAHLSDFFIADKYVRWHGETERVIDWQSGCCLLVRGEVLRKLGGFDGQFSYYYEDMDLCHRIWDSGYPIVYAPEVTITHLGGQSTTVRLPVAFELDKYRNRYRYYYKYFGSEGARRCRTTSLMWIWARQLGYTLLRFVKPSDALSRRLKLYRAAGEWNWHVDPVRFVEDGVEPDTPLQVPAQVPQ